MTATVSVAGVFRRWLIDQLSTSYDGVQVSYGMPRSGQREGVWLTPVVTATVETAHLSAGRALRTETILSTVTLVTAVNSTGRLAEERAFELLAVLENLIADNPKPRVDIPGSLTVKITGWELTRDDTGPEGPPLVAIDVTVETVARLN